MKRVRMDLTGQQFGRWTVVAFAGVSGHGDAQFLARCVCGVEKTVNGFMLRNGRSKSCGCLSNELAATRLPEPPHKPKGAWSDTPEMMAWKNMIKRCTRPKDVRFANYGARGIAVCERWQGESGFENFIADMGPRPSSQHSIDRIDNNGNYEPTNCRWATRAEQSRNRRNNHLLTVGGETLTVADWAARNGLNHDTILRRLDSGWPVELAVTKSPDRSFQAMRWPAR